MRICRLGTSRASPTWLKADLHAYGIEHYKRDWRTGVTLASIRR